MYKTAIMSKHLVLPRIGHLEQVFHIFGYLKSHKKLRILMDPSQSDIPSSAFKKYDWEDFYRGVTKDVPEDAPEPRGNEMTISVLWIQDLRTINPIVVVRLEF